ncbi:MAG: hypothetical protein F4Y02_03510 [Chloroflexi bacterium]|nr:hypothetical protein [Chloroflexota bacterium]
MADLRGVIFVGNGHTADGAAAPDGGGTPLDATIEQLREIGADAITVITSDPDAVPQAPDVQVQDRNAGHGEVHGLLQAIPRSEEVEILVAEHPLQPTADFQPSQGSNNCVLVVAEGAGEGRTVDVIELEYEERRRVTQFAVRAVNGDGGYHHTGLTFLPLGALERAARVGLQLTRGAEGLPAALPLPLGRWRPRGADDVLQDVASMNLDDLFDRFLFEGRLSAIKA